MLGIIVEIISKPMPLWQTLLFCCLVGWASFQFGRSREQRRYSQIATPDEHAQKAVNKTILISKRDVKIDMAGLDNYVLVVKQEKATLLNLDHL